MFGGTDNTGEHKTLWHRRYCLIRGGFHVTSSPPCWWTKTKDRSLDPIVRPPANALYVIPLLSGSIEIGCKPSISEEKAGKVFSRGETHTGVRYANFKEDKFSYLNITILGYSHVDRTPQCSLACLETPTCFSYNLAAKPDINGKLLCELLPSDKYNNSDKFVSNEFFHHFSIAVSRMSWIFMVYSVCFTSFYILILLIFFFFYYDCENIDKPWKGVTKMCVFKKGAHCVHVNSATKNVAHLVVADVVCRRKITTSVYC